MNLADAIAGTGAKLLRTTVNGVAEGVAAPSQLAETISGFGADSRSIGYGEMFFALPGERVDGHDFLEVVFAAGAAGAVVSSDWVAKQTFPGRFPPNRWLMSTAKPLESLQALGRFWRRKHDVTVIGITGSLGKTTVKDLTAQALSPLGADAVLKSAKNLNSEVGLPLQLLKLNAKHRYAVLEMGMYQRGDIRLLAGIARPKIGVVTNVQANHLERTGSLVATAQAKAELIQALPSDGLAILNADDHLVRLMKEAAQSPVTYFGTSPTVDFRASAIQTRGRNGFLAQVRHGGRLRTVACPLPGAHNGMNILPALATAHHVGVGLDDAAEALRLAPATATSYLAGPNGSTILDDSYNASAVSVVAAIELLKSEPGRRLALLGEMYELGGEEEAQHRRVGCAAAGLDFLILRGERTKWIAEEAMRSGLSSERIVTVDSNEEAAEAAHQLLQSGDTLLVKGSRGLQLEEVVAVLTSGAPNR